MNFLNLKLSGILPSQLFFPLVNGSAIILSTAASFIIFKEKLTSRQIVGLFGGIAALIAICITP
jgi:multidrug transporter EmrE-like cation transporter